MCGIVGVIQRDGRRPGQDLLEAMTKRLSHRGPDSEGLFLASGVGLGHRRLSVIDREGGTQPMVRGPEGRRTALVYNGEVYNFQDLAAGLEAQGSRFQTRSDTEVVLEAYRRLGMEFLESLNGMFALGIWDETQGRIVLARDRVGQKPLYYFMTPRVFVFSSELKALLLHPDCPRALSRQGLVRYLAFEYVPSPWTILEGVFKLEPGTLGILDVRAWRFDTLSYWRIPFGQESVGSMEEAADSLRERLDRSVRRRLVSDVPLGIFLSGGLDSTFVTGLAAGHLPQGRVQTFSIGFSDPTFDESRHARLAANHFETDHFEEILEPDRVWQLLGRISDILDEPLGDASVVPTHLLSAFARRQVTVALAGDGGDELFAGYPTFQAEMALRLAYRWQPRLFKEAVHALAERLPVSFDNISFDFKVKQFLKAADEPLLARHQIWLGSFAPWELERLLSPEFHVDGEALFEEVSAQVARHEPRDWADALMALYLRYYLSEDILVKTDRASMAVGLEVRAPFLDPEVIRLAASVPGHYRLLGLRTKHLLKQAASGVVPAEIRRRPKKGFGIPVAKWLSSELRPLAERLLDQDRLRRQGLFNSWEVSKLFYEHLARRKDNRKKLWTLMALELWMDRYGSGPD